MSNENDLIKCPFCGEDQDGGIDILKEVNNFSTYCFGCGVRGPIEQTPEECREHWNKRVDK